MPRPRLSSRIAALSALFTVLVAALSGCATGSGSGDEGSASSAPPPPPPAIKVGLAPSDIQALPLGGPLGPTGFYAPDKWPAACDLLDDVGVRAVLPQTEDIARATDPVTFPTVGPAPGQLVVPTAACRIAVKLPGTAYRPDTIYGSGYVVSVRVDAAGSDAAIAQNKPKVSQTSGDGAQRTLTVGPAQCVAAPQPVFQCATKHVKFSLALLSSEFAPDADKVDAIRYQQPEGPPVSFPRAGDAAQQRRKWEFESASVLTQLATVAAVKVSGG